MKAKEQVIINTYEYHVWKCPKCNKKNEFCGHITLGGICEYCSEKVAFVVPGDRRQLIRFFKAFQGETWKKAFILAEEWVNDWDNVNDMVEIESMSTSESEGNYSIVIMYRSNFSCR